ncbi:MAG TPA: hypothetical protein ENK46_12950 [Flavobacteriia bacterium]|nr:hypothetical protein [Flavobacteriia bacterium]
MNEINSISASNPICAKLLERVFKILKAIGYKKIMAKLNLGDIFEIDTKKGKGYFKLVGFDKHHGELIKVYYRLYQDVPPLNELENGSYYIYFPLKYALRQKLVKHVGNIVVSSQFIKPQYCREKHIIGREFLGWFIVDMRTMKMKLVKELNKEQKKLSPCGIINDTLLKKRLEQGWRLENWV